MKKRKNNKKKNNKKIPKKSRRSVLDSLKPSKVPKVRKELIDADYLDKLNPKQLEWYAKFMDEYVGANIRKNKKTNRVEKGHVHRKNAHVKAIYDANNRRNNDVHSVTKANHLLFDINGSEDGWYIHNAELTERAMHQFIEEKKTEESILSREEYIKIKDLLTPEVRKRYEKLYGA